VANTLQTPRKASSRRTAQPDHANAVALLEDADVALITGSWTRVEVSGALVRAVRTGRGKEADLLALLDADLGPEGPVTVVSAPQESVEEQALLLVRQHALRAVDAWHLATAALTIKTLADRARRSASRRETMRNPPSPA
jgi:predicted nucleic acid-binding protein